MKRIYFRPWTDWTRREFLLKLALSLCAWISSPLSGATEFNIQEFGRLPIVFNGRHQPFDSLARNSLLQIREKQTANIEPWKSFLEKPKVLSATEWILGVMFRPEESDLWPVFRIDHPDLISLLNLPRKDLEKQADGKHFAWNRIEPGFKELHDQRSRILDTKKDASQRDSFDQAVLRLYECVVVYLRIKNTVHPQDSAGFAKELVEYQKLLQPGKTGAEVLRAKYSAGNMDAARNDPLVVDLGRYYTASKMEGPLILPPADKNSTEWQRMGDSLMELRGGESLPLTIANYAKIADAYRQKDADAFNSGVVLQLREIETLVPRDIGKARQEVRFNALQPFYKTMVIYLAAFLCATIYWAIGKESLRKVSFGLVALGFLIHTVGLIVRMWLEGRPPVTNLYSSAIFIGWGAIVLGIILERFWKNGIGLVAASSLGFVTLIIAHQLSLSGDTLIMLQAVLDTNFWLATHVVIVTLGYASTFVAGFLAVIYVLRGFFTRGLDSATGNSLSRMVYGILCFATLFSFVGTVLGGIWADQSWGRFWGWDPKENGALIIVLWNAMLLHARWGGLVKARGIMNLAIAGNIVTAWSWFGVNMLGIGLHSYGFMNGAFPWLLLFVTSQLLLIAIGSLPFRFWRSPLQGATR